MHLDKGYGNLYAPNNHINLSQLVSHKMADHSDVVGASLVGAAPTTFSSST